MTSDELMICFCSKVTAGAIRQAMRDGAADIDDIRRMTGACTVGRCKELSPLGRCCSDTIHRMLDERPSC